MLPAEIARLRKRIMEVCLESSDLPAWVIMDSLDYTKMKYMDASYHELLRKIPKEGEACDG